MCFVEISVRYGVGEILSGGIRCTTWRCGVGNPLHRRQGRLLFSGVTRGMPRSPSKVDAIVGSLDRSSDKDFRGMMPVDFRDGWMMKIDPLQLGLESQAIYRL